MRAAPARRLSGRSTFVAHNGRHLILPFVAARFLASHLLARMAAILPEEWRWVWAYPIYCLETSIDPARFRGTCYRAANWVALGLTTGRGHNARTHRSTQPVREVLGYPLRPDFRALLGERGA